MKKTVYLLFLSVILSSCGNQAAKETATIDDSNDRIEVLYFHGAKRCITCQAIEDQTKALLDEHFANDIKNGTVVYKTIDISKKENEKIADRYEVTWSSLFVNKWKDGKETPVNLTDYAFTHAKGNPEQFKEGVKKQIEDFKK